MAQFMRQHLLGRWALRIVASLACASQAALVAITVTLATKNTRSDYLIDRIALAASFLGILTLPALITIAFLHQRRAKRTIRIVVGIASALLSLSAATFIMYTLIWSWNSSYSDVQTDRTHRTRTSAIAGFAVWIVTVVSQLFLYTMVLWPQQEQTCASETGEDTRPSTARSTKRSMSAQSSHVTVPTSTPSPDAEPLSSAFSAYSTSPRSSVIFKVIRPVTSRTKLLFQNSSVLPDTNSSLGSELSVRFAERSGTPENGLPAHKKKSFSRRFLSSQLETIPGSRSSSPANALNGPFSGHWNTPIESPRSPRSPRSPTPSSPSGSFKKLAGSLSRQESSPDQSHIHPLFRHDSPTPPPVALPGTVITASPHAGQIVNPDQRPFSPHRWNSTERKLPRSSLQSVRAEIVDADETNSLDVYPVDAS